MGEKEHKVKGKVIQQYSEKFKRQVCEEYLRTGQTKKSLLNKYDIRMKSGIQTWLRQLGYVDIHQKGASSPFTTSCLAPKQTFAWSASETDQPALEKRIKELEHLLQEEQVRSQALRRMLELAEQELKLPIRKKFNTK